MLLHVDGPAEECEVALAEYRLVIIIELWRMRVAWETWPDLSVVWCLEWSPEYANARGHFLRSPPPN